MSFASFDTNRRNSQFSSSSSSSVSSTSSSQPSSSTLDPLVAIVTDTITQYQKNTTILSQLAENLPHNNANNKNQSHNLPTTTQQQYNVQKDVIEQLGSRMSSHLGNLEKQINSLPRLESARYRSAHYKLTKDAQKCEQIYKNISMSVQRKLDVITQRCKNANSNISNISNISNFGTSSDEVVLDGLGGQLKQVHLQEDLINEEIIKERNEEIKTINQQMTSVNEIFKELAQIVHNQQDDVDNIEQMMENSHTHAKAGLEQIEQANEYQKGCLVS